MFGIPEWVLAAAFCFFLVVAIFNALTNHYTTHLPKPDGITWDEQPGICDECMGGADYSQYCEHWGACHH